MGKVFIEESTLTAIGDAIRAKNGSSELIAPQDMDTAIYAFNTEGVVIPSSAFTNGLYGNSYRFYSNNNDWMLDSYPNRFETLTTADYMFTNSRRTNIPITLKAYKEGFDYMFAYCYNLEEITSCEEGEGLTGYVTATNVFRNCYRLQKIADNFFGTTISTDRTATQTYDDYHPRNDMFNGCYSLMDLPKLQTMINMKTSETLYKNLAVKCYALNKIINLPVSAATLTTNAFTNVVSQCFRLKDFTFETDNGTPKTARWKDQTIDLSTYIGWASDVRLLTQYNADVYGRVTDELNYETYKNTEKWYTSDVAYSRYNLISAINTINSLPDTSTYLANNGGTNTIKFKNDAGRLTDGGRIDLLGEAQIAVAAAKGWTVALVDII